MINTIILDAIIWDNRNNQSLESHLQELEEMPENYINSVCEKSYDEMTSEEKEQSVASIEEYLNNNAETEQECLSRILNDSEFRYCNDSKVNSLEKFMSDDNLGFKKEIDSVVYYKMKDMTGEAQVYFFEGEHVNIV